MRLSRLPAAIALFLLTLGLGACQKEATPTTLSLYYEEAGSACGDTLVAIPRNATLTPRIADAAIRMLLNGLTPEQQTEHGVSARVFEPAAIQAIAPGNDTLSPLRAYYRETSVQNGTATVDFASGALAYLNSTACMQGSVKGPIERTLKQFPEITEVQYSIDGEVFTEWDA